MHQYSLDIQRIAPPLMAISYSYIVKTWQPVQSIMNSPRSIRSPRWSGFLILAPGVCAGGAGGRCIGISLGGSAAGALKDLLRLWPPANGGEPTEDLLFLSIMASDQLNPSPASSQYGVQGRTDENEVELGATRRIGADRRSTLTLTSSLGRPRGSCIWLEILVLCIRILTQGE